MKTKKQSFRSARWILISVYALLVIGSHLYQASSGGMDDALLPGGDRLSALIPDRGDDGQIIPGEMLRVVYQQAGRGENTPVLLMHGAPGMGTDFARLIHRVTKDGRAVYAPDLVGFAQSDMGRNVSYRVQAEHMYSFLDAMGVDRVHLVGWSNGGGVGLRMVDLDPDRVASLTMLASVGAQETEGSGSYFFEHVKYAVGFGVVEIIPDLIPHFGLLGSRELRTGWLWSFWDSDQRELTEIMPTVETPVMILHGRHDPLVPDWGAELHHEMMPTSKLVMLDASHFLPFMQAQETAGYLNDFFAKHDQPGVIPDTGYLNLSPLPDRHGFDALLHQAGDRFRSLIWSVQLILIVLVVRYWKLCGIVLVMILTAMMSVDIGVSILGMLIGRGWWLVRGAHAIDRPVSWLGFVRGLAFILPALIIGLILGAWSLRLTQQAGVFGFALGAMLMLSTLALARLIVSWEGRQRMKGQWNRITNHEYWMTGVVYIPMIWWGIKRMLSRRWLIELTSVNPGYADDGGIMCESKMDINRKLGDGSAVDDAVLHCVLIESNEDPQQQIAQAKSAMENDLQLGGYPVFCKPDQGERGRAVAMIRTESQLVDYCNENDEDFVIQRRHEGSMETGVLWVRHEESITNPDYGGASGFIYAITIKHFPAVIGDGTHSIRRLILGHKRYRAQSRMFFERMGDRLSDVPAQGERVTLGIAGNHAQGAMFTDGAHLITDELTQRIGEIVDRFVDEDGRGFDIGRFDLRCESLEQLAQGTGFGIVELNGLTSEPTNLYDPSKSFVWAWKMLHGYWMHAERLGEVRLATKTGEMVDSKSWKSIRNALIRVMLT